MPESIVGIFCILSGFIAIVTGLVLAGQRLQRVARIYRRHRGVLATMPEGWGVWFVEGFAEMMVGTNFVVACGIVMLWIVLGAWLASLGFRLTF